MRGKLWRGRSRAGDDAELDERVGGVKWCSTRWCARSLWGATLREVVGAEEPTEVTSGMTMMAIDEAWLWRVCRPEDDARSMVKMMAVWAIDDGSDGTVSRLEVRSIVNGDDGQPATVGRARKR